MTPESMAKDATEALAAGTHMTMTLPRGALRKLPGFPRGELLCESHDGRNVYSYRPERVLAWLAANGLINVKSTPQPNA
jgi:hypothetical protein